MVTLAVFETVGAGHALVSNYTLPVAAKLGVRPKQALRVSGVTHLDELFWEIPPQIIAAELDSRHMMELRKSGGERAR
jgi:hypothetical protein